MGYAQTQRLQSRFTGLYTVHDLCHGFGVTPMTIYLWRKNDGLPTLRIDGRERKSIRFVPGDVHRWAKQRNLDWKGQQS